MRDADIRVSKFHRQDLENSAVSDQTRAGKEKPSKNSGDNKQIRERNTDNKDNKGSDTRDDESPGKSNGRKNT
jgi:hypothetical protein